MTRAPPARAILAAPPAPVPSDSAPPPPSPGAGRLRSPQAHRNALGGAVAAGCPPPHTKFITVFRSSRGPSPGAPRDTLETCLPSSRTQARGKSPLREGSMDWVIVSKARTTTGNYLGSLFTCDGFFSPTEPHANSSLQPHLEPSGRSVGFSECRRSVAKRRHLQPQPRAFPSLRPSLDARQARRGLTGAVLQFPVFFPAPAVPTAAASALPPPSRPQRDPRRKVEPKAGMEILDKHPAWDLELLVRNQPPPARRTRQARIV